jgi:hypothetical protein
MIFFSRTENSNNMDGKPQKWNNIGSHFASWSRSGTRFPVADDCWQIWWKHSHASRKFRLFVARCDKYLSSIFNICQPSVHRRVSFRKIQSNFHGFSSVGHFYPPMERLKLGQFEWLRSGRRNLQICSDLSNSIF